MGDDRSRPPEEPDEDEPPVDPPSAQGGVVRTLPTDRSGDRVIDHASEDSISEEEIELSAPIEDLPRGTALGRYIILGRIAEGGMGVVYAAFDPDLDRKIAVKLLRTDPDAAESDDDRGTAGDPRTQLLREAQSAAKVSHPAVVQVHDVGTFDGGVFIAMEFVDGITLRRWMEARDEPFPWREVLRVFREAGRGLAAAHAAGVVHGDFKPANVLLGKGGRICVLDFGLAQPVQEPDEPDIDLSDLRDALPGFLSTKEEERPELTAGGPITGTPAYMAPEQHVGARPDPKTDQFAFCVAFYEALYGERPFSGNRRATLALEAINHRVRAEPPGANVPPWIREVLVRGLSPRRPDRYPSVEALLGDLDHDPVASRRRWIKGLGVLTMIGGGAAAAAYLAHAENTRCETDAGVLEGIWDPPRRETLRNAFLATGRPHAAGTWASTEGIVDDWVQQWLDYRSRACRATRVWGEASEELMVRRYACLDARLGQLAAFTRVYASATPTMVDRAYAASSSIPLPRTCVALEALEATSAPSESIEAKVVDLRADHDDAWAAYSAGDLEQARTRIEHVTAAIETLDYPQLAVGTQMLQGLVAQAEGDPVEAEQRLHAAAIVASREDLQSPLARIWMALARTVGHDPLREREAKIWADYAGSIVERLGDVTLISDLELIRGDIARAAGRAGDALTAYHDALVQGQPRPARALFEAEVLMRLGALVGDQNELVSAQRYFDRAVTELQEGVGPNHPDVAVALLARAEVRRRLGELDAAAEDLESALAIRSAMADEAPLALAELQLRMGAVELLRRRPSAALELLTEAVDPLRKSRLMRHRELLAEALTLMGRSHLELEQPEAAREVLEEVVALGTAADLSRHQLAPAEEALAIALWADPREHKRARELASKARDSYARRAEESEAVQRVEAWLAEHGHR